MCMKQDQKSRRCAAVASITLDPTLYTSTVLISAVESAVSRGKPRMSRYKHRPFPSWLVYIWFLLVIAALFSTLVFFSDSISPSASSLSLMLQLFATALPSMPRYLLPVRPLLSPPPCVSTLPILKPGFLSPPPCVSTLPILKPGFLSTPPCVWTSPCVSTLPILKPGFLSPPPCVSTPAPRSHSSSFWIRSTPVIPPRSLLCQPSCAARFFSSSPSCPSCLPLPSSLLSRPPSATTSAAAAPRALPPSAPSVPNPSSKSRVSSWKTKKSRTCTRTSSSSRTTSRSSSSTTSRTTSLSSTTSSPSRTTSTARSSSTSSRTTSTSRSTTSQTTSTSLSSSTTSQTTSTSRSSSSTTSSPSRTASTSSTNSSSQTTSPSRSSPTTSSPLPPRTTATSRHSLTTPESSPTASLSPPTTPTSQHSLTSTTPTSQHSMTSTTTPIVTSTTESEAGSTRAAEPFVRIYTTRTLTIHQPTSNTQDYPYVLTIPSGLLSLMAQSRTANSGRVSPSWSANTGTGLLPEPLEELVQSTGAEALPPTLQNPTCVHDGAPVKTHCPLCALWMCKNCSRMQSMDQWQYHLNTYYESLKLRTTKVTKSTTPFSTVLSGSILDDILPTEMDSMEGIIVGLLRLNSPFTRTSTRETLATTPILGGTCIETPARTVAATTTTEAE